MDTLKGIMIKYANERGGGLPLTPEEICNCVVLWTQQYAPTAITINGGEGVSINNELVDDNKKVITININPATINVAELVGLFEGSDSVVVDVNKTNDKIEIHLDQDIVTRISKSLVLPVSTPTEDVIPVVGVNGAQRYVLLSALGGGGGTKLYRHSLLCSFCADYMYVISNRATEYATLKEVFDDYYNGEVLRVYTRVSGALSFGNILTLEHHKNTDGSISDSAFDGVYINKLTLSTVTFGKVLFPTFTDTVTEI